MDQTEPAFNIKKKETETRQEGIFYGFAYTFVYKRNCVYLFVYLSVYTHTHTRTQKKFFFFFFFHHTTCGSTCDTLASSAAIQGDNTVSVAQGGTATPGATEQLLPPDRVFKKKTYVYIRSTKSGHYIKRSFIFILVQFVI